MPTVWLRSVLESRTKCKNLHGPIFDPVFNLSSYLLGTRSGAKVCRYEKFLREPGLESALALQVIFERPVAELFQGLFQKIEAQVRERAKKLAQNKPSGKLSPFATHKRQTLAGIASGHVKSQTKR